MLKAFQLLLLGGLCAFASGMVYAQNQQDENEQDPWVDLTITATKTLTSSKEIGSSVTVITVEDMRRQGHLYVADALRNVPGLDLLQSGGPGKTTSVFMRGANANHTLVLVDNIEVSDPITPGNTFDFANLTVDNIERIEVVRGPQSTLYGSDAIGGVIHIITKQGGDELRADFSVMGGSYGTSREAAEVSGGAGKLHYSVAASHFDHDGFSTADEVSGNTEEDGYRNTTLSGNLGYKANDKLDFNLIARFSDGKGDIDNGGGFGQDDPNFVSEDEQTFLRAQTRFRLLNDQWEQKIGVSLGKHDRVLENGIDAAHPASSSFANYNSEKLKLDWQNTIIPRNSAHTIVFGAETEEERGDSIYESQSEFGPFNSVFTEEKARTTGFYLQDQYAAGNDLNLTLGARLDDHDRFGSEATYRAAAAYRPGNNGTLLKAGYGTGFKAPTLYQLYSAYGELNLGAEKSRGWDAGVEQEISDGRFLVGLTLFGNRFENLIDFDSPTSRYKNVADAESTGAELNFHWRIADGTTLALAYTYLDTEDLSTGERLERRADDNANLRLNHDFNGRGNIHLGIRYTGPRDFQDFSTWPASKVTLGGFTLVNLAGSVRLGRHLHLFARVDNATDKDYQEVLGYGTPDASGYLGLRLDY